jgi:hypothetical protein
MVVLLSLLVSMLTADSTGAATKDKDTVHAINKVQVFTGAERFDFQTKTFGITGHNRFSLQPRVAPKAGFYIQYKWVLFAYNQNLIFGKSRRDNPIKATSIGATYLGDSWGILANFRHYKGLELVESDVSSHIDYPALNYFQFSVDAYQVISKKSFSIKSAFGYNKTPTHSGGAFLYFLHFDSQQWNNVPLKRQDSIFVPTPTGHDRYITNLIPEGGYAFNVLLGKKGFNAAMLLHAGIGASLLNGRNTLPSWGCAWDSGTIFQIGYNGKRLYSYILGKDDYLTHTQSKAQLLNNNLQSIFLVLGKRF